jgi:hypothetical protein
MIVGGRQIWAVSWMGKNSPYHFPYCLTRAQDGVRPGIVVKEKEVFHVSVSDQLYGYVLAVYLKFPCTARDVLRNGGREFYNNGVQRLTQCWHKCVENDGIFVERWPLNCKIRMNHLCTFYCYCIYIF